MGHDVSVRTLTAMFSFLEVIANLHDGLKGPHGLQGQGLLQTSGQHAEHQKLDPIRTKKLPPNEAERAWKLQEQTSDTVMRKKVVNQHFSSACHLQQGVHKTTMMYSLQGFPKKDKSCE